MKYEERLKVLESEEIMQYDKWVKEIPFIKFDDDWEVKVVPPYRATVARFYIKKRSALVSVYLDCYESLGGFGEPYWEVYPHGEDAYRCKMNDTQKLLQAIRESLLEQKNSN